MKNILTGPSGVGAGHDAPHAAVPVLDQRLGVAEAAVIAHGPHVVCRHVGDPVQPVGEVTGVGAVDPNPLRAVPVAYAFVAGGRAILMQYAIVIVADRPDVVGGDARHVGKVV